MSTTPPSAPPPNPQQDPRDVWRAQRQQVRMQQDAARAYARAQRDQAKAQLRMQRDQMKAEWKMRYGMRRSSILGPILLITLGVLFLLGTMHSIHGIDVVNWLGRWWPAVLVMAGIILLVEWGIDEAEHRRNPEAPHTYRGVGGGVGFLLVMLVLFGMGYHVTHVNLDWLRSEFGHNTDDDFNHWFGSEHETDSTQTVTLPAGASLSLDNTRGDIVITGESTDGQMHLSLHKVVYTNDAPDSLYKRLDPQVTSSSANVYVLIPQMDEGHASVTAEVPAGTVLVLKNSHGDVHVSGMNAAATLSDDHGDVVIDGIHGSVITHMNNGDFTAHNVRGPVAMDGSAGNINVAQVDGTATVNVSGASEAHFEQVSGAVHYHSNRTDFSMMRINGNVDMNGDAISGQDILGPVQLTTRSRNTNLARISGAVTISDSNANIELTLLQPVASVNVSTSHGTVDVTVPEHANFSIDAISSDGNVDQDIQANGIRMSESGHNQMLNGVMGSGGPELRLNTSHSTISLHQDGGLHMLPAMPALPALPALPGEKPERLQRPERPERPEKPEQPERPAAMHVRPRFSMKDAI